MTEASISSIHSIMNIQVYVSQEGHDHRQNSSVSRADHEGGDKQELIASPGPGIVFLGLGWSVLVSAAVFNRNADTYSHVHIHTQVHKTVK